MKTKMMLTVGVAAALALLGVGCGKEESKPTTQSATPESVMQQATEQAKKAVDATSDQAKKTADAIAGDAKAAADKAVAEAGKQVTAVVEKAKGLIAEKKYKEALASLQEIGNLKLSPDQQKMVDDLKAQVQKLMSGDAAKAVEGLLPKK